jgi:hypothetical protein
MHGAEWLIAKLLEALAVKRQDDLGGTWDHPWIEVRQTARLYRDQIPRRVSRLVDCFSLTLLALTMALMIPVS